MQKRLIFTITPGRSGTQYLSVLLSKLPMVDVVHEGDPSFSQALPGAQYDPEIARRFWVDKKLPKIEAMPGTVYVETSHLFANGFIQPLLDEGICPDIIVLKRPHRQVAESMYFLGDIPGVTASGQKYYLDPGNPSNFVRLDHWQGLHEYQLCYWHCLETMRRASVYTEIINLLGGTVVHVNLDDLKHKNTFLPMLYHLNLPQGKDTLKHYLMNRAKKFNLKTGRKMKSERNLCGMDQRGLEMDLIERVRFDE